MRKLCIILCAFVTPVFVLAQDIRWTREGNAYYELSEGGEILLHTLPANTVTTLISKADLTPNGEASPIVVKNFSFTPDNSKLLIFTKSVKVWRINSRGDYWILDLSSKKLQRLGAGRPVSSLMFAKISPDGQNAAYVSEQNVYVENLQTGAITALTKD